MNKTEFIKNPFAIQKVAAVTLCMLFFTVTGCGKQNSVWTVELKLKPGADESYLATENTKIKALISKHRVRFYRSYPGFNPPVFLLYYTLTGNSDRESTIKDFLATGMFDDNVRELCIHFACGVRLKLKPHADEGYLATDDPEIQALISKHGIAFKQNWAGFKERPDYILNPELLLYYSLTNEYYIEVNMVNVIQDFLATGKFEDDFHAYGEDAHPL